MGWKSTRVLTRAQATEAYLLAKLEEKKEKWIAQAEKLSDDELGDYIDVLGENSNLTFGYDYYGHNFTVSDWNADE